MQYHHSVPNINVMPPGDNIKSEGMEIPHRKSLLQLKHLVDHSTDHHGIVSPKVRGFTVKTQDHIRKLQSNTLLVELLQQLKAILWQS